MATKGKVTLAVAVTLALIAGVQAQSNAESNAGGAVPIGVDNFTRAESDLYMSNMVKDGSLGKFVHRREPASIDNQSVIRLNRDTLYSAAVFDLDAGPVTIVLPEAGKRFMSMQVINEDHYTPEVVYGKGSYALTKDKVGTRYVVVAVRTLVDPADPEDVKKVHALQDAIHVSQKAEGKFETPNWDQVSQKHSIISEIDDLGRSVFTMRTLIQTFANFVPRRLVQQLVLTGTPMTLGGSRRELTVLFTDVVNFTGITESAEPAQVMLYTSRYFSAVSEAVMASKGTIDKFIGDGVMAFWNAPAEDPDHALNACAGALAFLRANDRLNVEFEREGWPAYRTRIGLHTGEAVVGNIGSEDRMNYTALGATVNLAARLEGLNRNYGTSILVSAALRERASSRFVFRRVDRISPKGFAEAFEIYELRCERGEGDARDRELCREWEVVYAALRNGPRAVAESELSAFMRKYPGDEIARYHHAAARNSSGELGGHAA